MSGSDWDDPERDFIALQLIESQSQTRLWLAFYREDLSLTVIPPNSSHIKSVLFSTDETIQLPNNSVEFTRRSVLLVELLND